MTDNQKLIKELTADKSKGVKKIITNPSILADLTEEQLQELSAVFAEYKPVTPTGEAAKSAAMNNISAAIHTVNTGVAPVNDHIDRAKMVEDRTLVLFIKVTQPGLRKCIDPDEFITKVRGESDVDVDEEVDNRRHVVIQKLFGNEFVNPLFMNRLQFMSWLKHREVKSTFLAGDHFLVPRTLFGQVSEKIDQLIIERNKLLDEFEAQYETAKLDAKIRLGVHYDEARYPDFSEIRSKFKIQFFWRSLSVPSALKDISKAMYEQEKAKAQEAWENTFEAVRDGLRVGFTDLIDSFKDSLVPDANGKLKGFNKKKIEKLKDFLSTFSARDLTDDDDLALLAKQAEDLIDGVDPATLRKSADMRSALSTQFKEIAEQAAKLVEPKGRKLKLDEDED